MFNNFNPFLNYNTFMLFYYPATKILLVLFIAKAKQFWS